jgi:adenylyltransferase/sulfurtransferase
MRSASVIKYLVEQGFDNLYNLTGGIHAWSIEVEPEMMKY